MSEFRTLARIAEAAMRSVFEATPLQRNAHLSQRFGADIYLKREDLTPVRSYKLRGAFNAMRKVLAADPTKICLSVLPLGIMRRVWPICVPILGCVV